MNALSLLFDFPVSISLTSIFLLMGRLAPLVYLVPWMGSQSIPTWVRLVLLAVLTVTLAPFCQTAGVSELSGLRLTFAIFYEILIGTTLALCLSVTLHALEWAGSIIHQHLGLPSGQADAVISSSKPLGQFSLFIGILLVFGFNLHHSLWKALGGTLQTFPLGYSAAATDWNAWMLGTSQVAADMFSFAVQLAAPLIAVLFLVDFVFSLLSRAASSLPVFFLSMPLKASLGLFVFALFLFTWISVWPERTQQSFSQTLMFFEALTSP